MHTHIQLIQTYAHITEEATQAEGSTRQNQFKNWNEMEDVWKNDRIDHHDIYTKIDGALHLYVHHE